MGIGGNGIGWDGWWWYRMRGKEKKGSRDGVRCGE